MAAQPLSTDWQSLFQVPPSQQAPCPQQRHCCLSFTHRGRVSQQPYSKEACLQSLQGLCMTSPWPALCLATCLPSGSLASDHSCCQHMWAPASSLTASLETPAMATNCSTPAMGLFTCTCLITRMRGHGAGHPSASTFPRI